MTKGYYETCKSCGRDYYYESTGNIWPGGKERENAVCPYYKSDGPSEFISGFIYSYKLDENGKPIKF